MYNHQEVPELRKRAHLRCYQLGECNVQCSYDLVIMQPLMVWLDPETCRKCLASQYLDTLIPWTLVGNVCSEIASTHAYRKASGLNVFIPRQNPPFDFKNSPRGGLATSLPPYHIWIKLCIRVSIYNFPMPATLLLHQTVTAHFMKECIAIMVVVFDICL